MNRITYDTVYLAAWLLCVITLPLTIPLNSLSLILLCIAWFAELNFSVKWQRLRRAYWTWPFIVFFVMHIVGLIYSEDQPDGRFEIEKKLSFLILPVIAASGKAFSARDLTILKKGFTWSCLAVVVISLVLTIFNLINHSGGLPQNFDAQASEQFHLLNPNVSAAWEYFSYIQLGNWIDIHPAYFSMYLIFCIALLTQEMLDNGTTDRYGFIIIGIFTLFIGLLASRMAIISYVVLLSYAASFYVIKNKNYKVLILSAILVLSLSTWVFINPVSRFRLIQEPLHTSLTIDGSKTEWNSVNYRLLEWEAAITKIKKSWTTGVGTGDGQAELQRYYSAYSTGDVVSGYNAHNQYLQTLLELGIAGLCLLMICILGPFFSTVPLQPVHIAFVILFGLMCLTESMLARQKGIVFFTMFQSLFFRYSCA